MIDQLMGVSTLAEFEAMGLDFPHVVRSVIDVAGRPRKATKTVIKAFAEVFQSKVVIKGKVMDGYPVAVEMLAFAAVCAPLLEPDRLARLVTTAPRALVGYYPKRTFILEDSLTSLMEPYSQQVREVLLKDLWFMGHCPSWWRSGKHVPVPEVAPTLASLSGVIRVCQNPARYGLNGVEGEEWVQKALDHILAAASSHEPSSPEDVAVGDLARLEQGAELGLSDESRLALQEVFSHSTFLRENFKPSTVVAILGRFEALLQGVAGPGGPSEDDVEFFSSLRELGGIHDESSAPHQLASNLVAREVFQEAYAQAPLIDRVVLSTSVHVTPEQADALAADLDAAADRIEASFKEEYLRQVKTRLSSPRLDEGNDSASSEGEAVDFLGSIDATSPGKFLMAVRELDETSPLGFDVGGVALEVVDGLLGDGSSMERLKSLRMGLATRQPHLDWKIFAALSRIGLMFAGKFHEGCRMFSALKVDLALLLLLPILRTAEVYSITHPLFAEILDLGDPYLRFELAHLAAAVPLASRFISPIVSMVRNAEKRALRCDLEDTVNPRQWVDVAFRPDTAPYPYAGQLQALDGQPLPGAEGTRLQLVGSEAALTQNAERMGNCTRSYTSKAAKGTWALFYFVADAVEYNASILLADGTYSVEQVNTRFNRGNVSPEVQASFERLIAGLNT